MMEFNTDIFAQFDKKWALLTAGSMENFNNNDDQLGWAWYVMEQAGGECICQDIQIYA